MRRILPIVLVGTLLLSTNTIFAVDTPAPATPVPAEATPTTPAPATPVVDPAVPATPAPATPVPATPTPAMPTPAVDPVAPVVTPVPAVTPTSEVVAEPVLTAASSQNGGGIGSQAGDYQSVSCSSDPSFGVNSCDQCFEGRVTIGKRITGLYDAWVNNTNSMFVAYKGEQKSPNMVKFGASTWASSPADDTKMWKNSSDIIWDAENNNQFLLAEGTRAKFYEADIGAGYTLEKTDKKPGEVVGMLRFPTVYHTIDMTTADESAPKTHYECVAYKLEGSEVAPPASTPNTPQPTPPEVTKTETGPETLLLIAAAFFIAFGMMFALRRRV